MIIDGIFIPILSFQLKILYPDLDLDLVEIEIDEDGNERIIKFPEGLTLPTQEQLEEVFIPALKEWKAQEIKEICAKRLARLLEDVSDEEVQTFWIQVMEAKEYQKDPNAFTPFIDTLAGTRGISKDELVQRIIARANAYSRFAASYLGYQQRLLDKLFSDTCNTVEDIMNIKWDDSEIFEG